jgi:hypothetical protein
LGGTIPKLPTRYHSYLCSDSVIQASTPLLYSVESFSESKEAKRKHHRRHVIGNILGRRQPTWLVSNNGRSHASFPLPLKRERTTEILLLPLLFVGAASCQHPHLVHACLCAPTDFRCEGFGRLRSRPVVEGIAGIRCSIPSKPSWRGLNLQVERGRM